MTSPDLIWLLRGLMGVILVVGTLTAYYALAAGRRARSRSMLLMGGGFVLISLAAASAGLVYEILTHDPLTAWTVSAGLSAAGFVVILYSLLVRESAPLGDPAMEDLRGEAGSGAEVRVPNAESQKLDLTSGR
ncbi:MAG: hypothetical protein KGJ23_09755 [Euryarchaeota archaeon]|nr:hypothetical protein [Euryarchaeota archaeon]MDE1836887.1 hypothetical protein [Euryarchaeota archaeon]MDE1881351.1 hypothetical protein [Euryarchaeota archaeon]MDE2045290.1 hypothetical protein [Thermoplasmata archaeon]